jgi:putative tricarboxylic transport membrane protein
MATTRGLRLGEAVLAAFVLLLGVFVSVETAMLRTGPGYSAIGPKLFPWLVAAGLLLVGAA